MTSKLALALSLAAVTATAALAANVLQVKQTADVKGKPADVWAKVGAFCAIKDWHPAVANCEEVKEGDVVRRILTLKDGAKIKEKLTGKNDDSYTYNIEESPLPVKNYNAYFGVRAAKDKADEATLLWTASFEAKGKPDVDAKTTIEGIFSSGLKAIQDGKK